MGVAPAPPEDRALANNWKPDWAGAVRAFPWQNLRYEHVNAIKGQLQQLRREPRTINAALSAIRAVSKACFNLKLMSADDLRRIESVKMTRVDNTILSGREVKIGELESLVRVCVADPNRVAGVRDVVAIGLLYITGLRRFEASALKFEDLDFEENLIIVKGKGKKTRKAYPDPGTWQAINDWLTHRTVGPGPLLLKVNKAGAIDYQNGRLSDQAIYNLIKKRRLAAGVPHCTPHDFRRAFGTTLLRNKTDLLTVMKLMGHADPKTTKRYDMRSDDEAREASEIFHLPYSGA